MYRVLLLFYLAVGVFANDENSPKILIVGAGASGIAAASKLIEHGFDDLVILEAEDRIGGRICSVDLAGETVELGAQWIDGEIGNQVFELADPLDLLARSKKHVLSAELYASPGVQIDPDVVNEIRDFYFNITEDPTPFTDNRDDSIGDFLEEQFMEYFANHPEINETMQQDFLWFFNVYQTATDGSDSWTDVSAKKYSEYHVPPGDPMVNWKERGFSTLFDILMKKIPNPEEELPVLDKVVFNAEVTQIDCSDEDGPVKVETSDGKEYLADHVIVTVSLGVLKEDHDTLFKPPLPESKVNSIKGLGFGAAAKIWLSFNDTWWEDKIGHIGSISVLWNKQERFDYWDSEEEKWIPSIAAFVIDDYRPHSLQVWVSGLGARFVDTIPDDLLLNQTMDTLNKYLSHEFNITTPVAMARSQWTTNKHFRGVYSFDSMETVEMNATRKAIAEPIMRQDKPVVLFAGEATNEHQFGTTHGAVGSGWREADRLINMYHDINSGKDES